MSWVSLAGMIEAYPEVLSGFVVPAAVDRETVINSMCLETVDLELLYSDPRAMKIAIDVWSHRRLPVWTKLEATLHYEYNPIHNYDRTEERQSGIRRKTQTNQNRDFESGEDIKVSESSTDNNNSDTTTQKAGYDGQRLVTSERVTEDRTLVHSADNSSSDDIKSTDTLDRDEDETVNEAAFLRNYGNIGVTSTQQLIEQERQISEFDIVQYIVDDFKSELCILVY